MCYKTWVFESESDGVNSTSCEKQIVCLVTDSRISYCPHGNYENTKEYKKKTFLIKTIISSISQLPKSNIIVVEC
jgi:hypothetical protein